jgi:6-pyruvoyltetrahydropterin/6-carboxytetrahydropterin synthase
MAKFISTKVFDGYSSCFRQWKAEGTHCKFLHSYNTYFKVWFEADYLNENNWVFDFGMRGNNKIAGKSPKEYFSWLLDHTTIVAESDPELDWFLEANKKGILQLRILKEVGCEKFAEFIFNDLNTWVIKETDGRVRVIKVEFSEHSKNSAIYEE